MGSVINRGTRSRPNYYIQFKEDGRWRMKATDAKSKEEAKKLLLDAEEKVKRKRQGVADPDQSSTCSELMKTWKATLTNRNADDDRSRIDRHLMPKFGAMKIGHVTLRVVMEWIDEMKAGTAPVMLSGKKRGRVAKVLSGGSQRANVNLLSRFFSWAVEREHAQVNPVRLIPMGKRPRQAAKSDTPWVGDDKLVRDILHALSPPFDLMFYLGNRSGLRLGEICGLRMSDMDFLGAVDDAGNPEPLIRVRFSYDGPLKEDKDGEGKVKWAPAAEDCEAVLAHWLAARRAANAQPEDYLFPNPHGSDAENREAMKQVVEGAWDRAMRRGEHADEKNPPVTTMTFYQATRHSFVSRNLKEGASLDEVSAAVGHSSPIVTKRYYDHFVRKQFSSRLRRGLGVAQGEDGKVLSMPKR